MKKPISIIISITVFLIIFLFCTSNKNRSIESTNLKDIKLNSIYLNDSISEYENAVIEENDNDWDYELNGAHIFINDKEQIKQIIANEKITLSDGTTIIECDYDNVIKFLGDNYISKNYDYSQGLKEHVYIDREHNIQLEVIFMRL
ncbi:hypothetical protein [Pseudobutyrivibrio xylanivorans]|uniref:Uncharacterized protein n=1 Tax=Pseudobutyrivibrio xylanivorans TaxID=185007 RepID=A0A1G5S587_PSEXY|nr:hypothetical protein [Pseudobutyrivibrio xylanivorans]SCZ81562.1 hypothetical protein SAMN02910350_02875 [Pseudobutyrivibrio xylanivorans]